MSSKDPIKLKKYNRKYHKKYYLKHKDDLKIKNRIYYDGNRENKKVSSKKYYQEHKEEHSKLTRDYYLKHKEDIKKDHRNYYATHTEYFKEYHKDYNFKNRDRNLKRGKAYDLKNKSKIKKYKKVFLLMERYNLSFGQFNQMKLDQNNCCAIHKGKFKNIKSTCVDHIHDSNPVVVRGLLCSTCNHAIGQCNDDPKIIQSLINYLNMNINNGEYGGGHLKETKLKREKMILEQDNKCFTCNTEFKNSRDCHLDHNHKTNKIRKVLCSKCNRALGFFKERIKIMQSAIDYLNKWSKC